MTARELAMRKRDLEKAFVADVLAENDYNIAKTARELGLRYERVKALRDKLGLPVNRTAGPRVDGTRTIERTAVRAALAETGGSVKAAVRLTGVPETTVRRWRDEWRAAGEAAACQD